MIYKYQIMNLDFNYFLKILSIKDIRLLLLLLCISRFLVSLSTKSFFSKSYLLTLITQLLIFSYPNLLCKSHIFCLYILVFDNFAIKVYFSKVISNYARFMLKILHFIYYTNININKTTCE